MKFEMPIILRSRVEAAITRGRLDERNKVKDELDYEHKQEIIRLEDKYKLKLSEKDSEIKMLGKVIDDKNNEITRATKKWLEGKGMVLKAKEIIAGCDYAYRQHIEGGTRIMTWFKDARKDIEEFTQNLID